MFTDGAVFSLTVKLGVTGHAFALMQYFYGGASKTHVHLFFDQPVGNTVVLFLNFNIVVYVYPGFFPPSELVTPWGKSLQGRS